MKRPPFDTLPTPQPREEAVQATVRAATQAFRQREASRPLSQLEFLRQQAQFLHKRWWLLQGAVLVLLWWLLQSAGTAYEVQRAMGTLAPLFVVLVLPELWKHRSSGALEIECTAYYSLRQIYAARMVLFGLVDLALLTLFFSAALLAGQATLRDLIFCSRSWSPAVSVFAPCPTGGIPSATRRCPSAWPGPRCGCCSSSVTRSTG